MHRVVHEKIESGTFAYIGVGLTNWNAHSNLLNVVR
jgi:hypothetical protein